MTEDRLPLADLLAKGGEADFLRGVAEAVVTRGPASVHRPP